MGDADKQKSPSGALHATAKASSKLVRTKFLNFIVDCLPRSGSLNSPFEDALLGRESSPLTDSEDKSGYDRQTNYHNDPTGHPTLPG